MVATRRGNHYRCLCAHVTACERDTVHTVITNYRTRAPPRRTETVGRRILFHDGNPRCVAVARTPAVSVDPGRTRTLSVFVRSRFKAFVFPLGIRKPSGFSCLRTRFDSVVRKPPRKSTCRFRTRNYPHNGRTSSAPNPIPHRQCRILGGHLTPGTRGNAAPPFSGGSDTISGSHPPPPGRFPLY